MSIQLSLDRFEGKNKELAVLLADSGESIVVPRSFLPAGALAGEVLTLSVERDAQSTRKLAEETKRVQDKLSKRDPGGDIKL